MAAELEKRASYYQQSRIEEAKQPISIPKKVLFIGLSILAVGIVVLALGLPQSPAF
jgi:hypothetical protein